MTLSKFSEVVEKQQALEKILVGQYLLTGKVYFVNILVSIR